MDLKARPQQPTPPPTPFDPPPPETAHYTKVRRRFPWKGILGFLAALALAGGVYAWQQKVATEGKKESDDIIASLRSNDKQSESKIAELQKLIEEAKTTAPTASTGYVEVKELGFKLKPGADLADLVKVLDTRAEPAVTVYFSSSSLMAAAFKANSTNPVKMCSPTQSPLGQVKKLASNDTTKLVGGRVIKEFTSFKLAYFDPATCSDDKAAKDLAAKQAATLQEALKTAEEIK